MVKKQNSFVNATFIINTFLCMLRICVMSTTPMVVFICAQYSCSGIQPGGGDGGHLL